MHLLSRVNSIIDCTLTRKCSPNILSASSRTRKRRSVCSTPTFNRASGVHSSLHPLIGGEHASEDHHGEKLCCLARRESKDWLEMAHPRNQQSPRSAHDNVWNRLVLLEEHTSNTACARQSWCAKPPKSVNLIFDLNCYLPRWREKQSRCWQCRYPARRQNRRESSCPFHGETLESL